MISIICYYLLLRNEISGSQSKYFHLFYNRFDARKAEDLHRENLREYNTSHPTPIKTKGNTTFSIKKRPKFKGIQHLGSKTYQNLWKYNIRHPKPSKTLVKLRVRIENLIKP